MPGAGISGGIQQGFQRAGGEGFAVERDEGGDADHSAMAMASAR